MNIRKTRPLLNRLPSFSTENKLFLIAASALLPLGLMSLILWVNPGGSRLIAALVIGLALLWIVIIAFAVKGNFTFQIRTLNTLIEALRTEDYSLRSGRTHESGDLAELYQQINSLTEQLQKSRQDEQELRHLLERIIGQINVAIIACDHHDKIILSNHQVGKLLSQDEKSLQGTPLGETPIAGILPDKESGIVEFSFPGASGRWQINKYTFVQDGKRGMLVFITDLEKVLSEIEVRAWQRLIRVIAHEVNNSLTPVNSLCQTLQSIINRTVTNNEKQTLLEGLEVINERALNLNTFIADYARIARLPEADKRIFKLAGVLNHLLPIFNNSHLQLTNDTPDIELYGDPAQIEQLLINLIKNAVEANQDESKPVEIKVTSDDVRCEIAILDRGPGILNPNNLFVPFYTTKSRGAGIGLVLCRQIASAHHGEISLGNRGDGGGAIASVKLPLALSGNPH